MEANPVTGGRPPPPPGEAPEAGPEADAQAVGADGRRQVRKFFLKKKEAKADSFEKTN